MLKRLRFALIYALRNMRRDRQRTAFALFSIAAGVATVVALRSLGLMLTDALTSNSQAFLRGDVRVESRSMNLQVSGMSGKQSSPAFSASNTARINTWAKNNGIEITYTLSSELMQAAVVQDGKAGRPAFVTATFIDPKIYPFYDVIHAQEPSGVLLRDLFSRPDQVVVGKRLADQLGIKVGDLLRLSATDVLHMVKGIVPDSAESTMSNPFSLLFSFVYLDQASLPKFNLQPGMADRAYLKLPPGVNQADIQQTVYSSWPYPTSSSSRGWSITTADQTLRSNLIAADVISRFVLLLSLVGLVIGGVGIINTMLVTVNRRSGEIAVLKTLGLKGRGVSLIFLIEAILSGILGSLLGIVLGIGLSFIARDFGEEAFGVALPWRLYADPMVIGMALGIAVTLFFSFLPTLMAGQIRPAIVLRQGGIPMARAGCLMSLVSLIVLVVGMGLIIDLIIGNASRYRIPIKIPAPLTIGILTSLIVFFLLGLIIGVMWVLVWLIGRLPSFRNADLRIAIRGLTMHRNRTALSLLALITGMTALSGTLIMTRSINVLLYTSISEPMGGNVIIVPLLPVDNLARSQLDSAHGVTGYRDIRFTSSRLVAINGNRNYEQQLGNPDDPHVGFVAAQLELLLGINVHGNPPRGQLIEGRFLGTEDAEQRHIVIPYVQQLAAMGVKVGSTFTYRLGRNGQNVDFEVVGVVAPDARSGLIPFSLSDSAVQAPVDALPKDLPMDFIIADVDPQSVNDVMASVGNIPGIFVFDIGIFDSMINRILNQMAALPLLIAGLSLFAAAALIATTVSLATMERRRQIGILKAIGVKRRRALKQLLIENGIIGVAGGIISLLPTLLILGAVPALTEGFVTLPVPYDLIALMLILAVVITLGATLLTAWSAASEKPLTVLRYE